MANKNTTSPEMLDASQTVAPPYLQQQQEPLPNPQYAAPSHFQNIPYAETLDLAALVACLPGQVVSKTLTQNPTVGITLFAMAAGEGISAHKSSGDAFVTVLKGSCEITIDEGKFNLEQGQCIIMPANHPHAVRALEDFKMLLVVVFG